LILIVRTGLAEAGLDFGVFGPTKKVGEHETNGHGNGNGNGVMEEEEEEALSDDNEVERKSRPVIKLRPSRHGTRCLSSSRSRRDLSQVADAIREPLPPDDNESVANIRFSARIVAKTDLTALMPFALIAPEPNKRRPRRNSTDSGIPTPKPQSEDGHTDVVPKSPASTHPGSSLIPILPAGPPDDLKGVFIRKFRWGTVDVLDPNHCDFAALRTAVLSTHLKVSLDSTLG
jgi:Septin